MAETQLWQYFKDSGWTRHEIADWTGLKLGYINNLFCGADPLSPSARYKFMLAFPETRAFLFEDEQEAES